MGYLIESTSKEGQYLNEETQTGSSCFKNLLKPISGFALGVKSSHTSMLKGSCHVYLIGQTLFAILSVSFSLHETWRET